MKKVITTILSVLMLISCLTVNVFAEDNEQNIQQETTIFETETTDKGGTDNTNPASEPATSGESDNDSNTSRQTVTNASVTVDDVTVSLNQHTSGFWDFDFSKDNVFNVYQAIAFEKEHFIVSYNGIEIHGNCSESGVKKFDTKIKDGWYSYVLENDTDGLSFDLRIDPGVDAKIGEFTPSVTVGDKVYGFSRKGESNLFLFNPGENYQPPENFDFGSCKIDIASGKSIRSYDTKGNGVYQNSYVDLYIILWHKTDNGFDNICLALFPGNGPQHGPVLNIKEASLLFGNSVLPLFAMNMNNDNILWAIDFGSINENARRAYYDYIKTPNPEFQIKYKIENSEQYLYNNSFSLGLIDIFNIYGKYSFINVDDQNNYFILNPNTPAIDMDNIDSIEVTMNGETRTVNLTKSEVIDRYSYYKPDSPIPFNKDSSFDVTVTSGNNRNTYEDIGNYYQEEKGSVVLKEQSALLYDKARGSYVVICTNYEVTDKLSSSYIKPINNEVNFKCNINNNDTEFFWTFNVSVEQLYSGDILRLSFKNNTTESITFYQTQDSINQSGPVKTEKTEEGFDVYAPLNKESRFEAKKGDSVQNHIIRFDCDYEEVKSKTPIENLGFSRGVWFNLYDSTYNNTTRKFDLISIWAQLDNNSFIALMSEIQQGLGVNLGNYYTMILKKGCSIVGNPAYEIVDSNRGKIIKVKYKVANGSSSSQIVLNIERNFNQDDMSQVFVGNKEFNLVDTIDGTKIYISSTNGPILQFNANEIANAVNSESKKYNAVFVDYDFEYLSTNNSKQYPKEVFDGYEVDPNCSISLKLYYLDDLDILNGGSIEYADLTQATSFKKAINTRFSISQFDYYPGAGEHRLKTELKIPYKVNGGSLLPPSSTKETPDQNTGVSVWVNYSVNNETNQIEFYRNMSFMKPASIVHYFIAGSDDGHFEYDRVIYVGGNNNEEYPASAYGLEKAINDLRNAGRSSVVLLSDVNLERNAYLKHTSFEHVEDPYSPLQDIEINLNGHNINTGNYSLVNLRTSTIHITNYVVDENGRSTDELNRTAKITGSNANPAIINYGGLYVLSNITVENKNITVENKKGTGVVTYNSGDLFLTNGTKIDAAICVDIRENEMFSDGRNSANIDIRGELNASYIAIQSTTAESDVVNNINLYSGSVDNSVQKVKITSSDIGIRTIGNVNINVYGCEIYADSPLIMSGGTIEVRHANFSSTNGEPVILVDSNNVKATDTTILIAAEANVCMSTSGTLIEEISSPTKSKIKSIYFYSINSKDESYFDYAKGKLFEFDAVPSSNSILINGGCFSDQSYKNYLQGAVINEKTVTNNNKTYYYNLKNSNVTVSTFQDLKSALENSAVESVRLSNDISATTGSVISFEVNSPKVLFTNGFTIKNVKFEPVTTDQEASKAFFTIDGEGRDTGKLINEGVVIESGADQIFLRYIDIESIGDVAIKINSGELFAQNNLESRTIKGAKAIEVNVGNANNTIGNISINNYNLTGIAGPAIDVIKTNEFTYLNLQKCNIRTLLDNDSSDSSAVRINDTTRLSAQSYSVIEGTKYGVYFTDSLPGDGFVNTYAGLQLSRNTKVSADIAFRLGNYTTVHLDNIFVEAETSVLELHGFTQYVITAGEYKLTKGEDIITFVGVDPNNDYHRHRITGGYYSYELPDNEIFNDPKSDYFYDCLPVSLSNNPLPWLVARSIKGQNNFQYIEVPAGREVTVDGDKLDNAYDKEETSGYDSFDIVLTVKYKNDSSVKEKFDGHGNGFKEYYDIHVDKIVDNVAVDNVDSTKNYQHITIPLNEVNSEGQNIIYEKIDNVKVYHKHGNSDPVVLKKINKNKATDAREECYYLEEINGTWYLNIITRQFSDFAIAEDVNSVETSELKTDYSLNLQYKDTYYLGDISVPEYAVYADNSTISVQDVDVVYYSLDENDHYYGKDLPKKPGTYMTEWTVKEGKEITGSGKKQFVIKPAYLSSIKMKDNLVYSGEPIKLIENISNISDYSFKLVDSKNEPKIFDGIIPVAVNAGTYQLWYSKNDVTEFIGNVIINKATIMLNKPAILTATYGDILSDIGLPTGWSWKDETLSVGNATTTGNKFKAIFTPSDIDNYNVVEIELPVVVNKADTDIKTITIPSFSNAEKGTLLSSLTFTESGWSWVNPKDAVGDSNYAIYNPNRNNYNDLLISIPVYIKETVAGKDVSISNTVKADEKLDDIKVENNNITQSVLDIIKNVKSDTVVTGDAKEFISSSGNESLTISTELVKNEVTESAKNEALEKAEVKAENVAMVLDFKINIKVTKGSETKTGTITELAEPVKLTVKLPEGSKTTAAEGKELKYYVLVIHGDDVLKIPATLNAADGTVTFSSDKFSTYILVSEEVTKTVAENSTPSYVPSANKKPVVNTAAK